MRILHVSTFDSGGGAARAAQRLHAGLRALGHDSSMYVLRKSTDDPRVTAFVPGRSLRARVTRRLRRAWMRLREQSFSSRPPTFEIFSQEVTAHGHAPARQQPAADLVNLHWVARFMDYGAFFSRSASGPPLVWTLHDMNPFTGGCHYDDECGRFVDRCGACPQLGSSANEDLSRAIWDRKRAALERVPPDMLHVVAPSDWLGAEARRSGLLRSRPISVIPYGIDLEIFKPIDRLAARDVLALRRDARVVLFVADLVTNERKGLSRLVSAMTGLSGDAGVVLAAVGTAPRGSDAVQRFVHLGAIQDERLMSVAYNAADVFVLPSLADNLPLTALEALGCGTPIVAFRVGGTPMIVRDGQTGILVERGDVIGLRRGVETILGDDDLRRRMSDAARAHALREFGAGLQARRYAALYESILGRKASRRLDAACRPASVSSQSHS